MKSFYRFDDTGRYTSKAIGSDDSIAMENPDRVWVGEVDPTTHYHDFETGGPVAMPPKPSPEMDHFNLVTKQWEVDEAKAEFFARAKRIRLLADSDWVTLRSVESGTPVPQAWAQYRQALRDLPMSNPTTIVWPEPPAF